MNRIHVLLEGVQGIHIDVIRPPYSERPSFSEELIRKICRSLPGTKLEIHLMAPDPLSILSDVRTSCVDEPTPDASVHIEAFRDLQEASEALREIRHMGFRPGIALDLLTPIDSLDSSVVEEAKLIHVMSVPAGRGGQRFDPRVIEKVRLLKEAYPLKILGIDGGIDEETGRLIIEAGADRLTVGSRITGSDDPIEALRGLRKGLRGR